MTVEDLLTGKTIDRPPAQASVKRAPKAVPKVREQRTIFDEEPADDPF